MPSSAARTRATPAAGTPRRNEPGLSSEPVPPLNILVTGACGVTPRAIARSLRASQAFAGCDARRRRSRWQLVRLLRRSRTTASTASRSRATRATRSSSRTSARARRSTRRLLRPRPRCCSGAAATSRSRRCCRLRGWWRSRSARASSTRRCARRGSCRATASRRAKSCSSDGGSISTADRSGSATTPRRRRAGSARSR